MKEEGTVGGIIFGFHPEFLNVHYSLNYPIVLNKLGKQYFRKKNHFIGNSEPHISLILICKIVFLSKLTDKGNQPNSRHSKKTLRRKNLRRILSSLMRATEQRLECNIMNEVNKFHVKEIMQESDVHDFIPLCFAFIGQNPRK